MTTLMASRGSQVVVTTTTHPEKYENWTPDPQATRRQSEPGGPAGSWKAVRAMSQPGEARTVADPTDSSREVWAGLLDHYRETAVQILGVHQCSGTECSSCGQHWPCRAACAAEIALEL
jgi:hypothetical protein